MLGLALALAAGLATDQGPLTTFWLRLVAWLAVSAVAVGLARARTRREAHLWDLATSDPLTGLANRRLLLERLEAQLSVRGRTEDAAVLYLDLDRFKQVNDTRGHDVGDAVLVEVAARLRWAVRREDTVARLGGDEFVVACAAIEGEPGVEHLARRITESLQEPIAVRGAPATVGVTIGVLLVAPDERPDAESALHAADTLLLEAKARSGTGVRLLQARYRPAGLPGRTSSVDPAASA
ncbi:MAG: diguanylate cyclase [Frankiales bacterium]|nr:diguanylate cyclase [Frankiales bacterium]